MAIRLGTTTPSKLYLGSTEVTKAYLGATEVFSSSAFDSDAQAYITAVETADEQALEIGVKTAINDFVVGCKADGIWTAIKASCILAGARTLTGALVPLKGTAPTNYNFVSGDYDRNTGLVGNATSKNLDSNRNNNADPQDSNHNAVYITVATSVSAQALIGASDPFNEVGSNVLRIFNTSDLRHQNRRGSNVTTTVSSPGPPVGLVGHSRAASETYTVRGEGVNYPISSVSQATNNRNVAVFARTATGANWSSCRLAFYSIGEAIDLALLDARVTTLISNYTFAINTGLNPFDYDANTIAYVNAGYAAGGTLA
jgi:hypothetical protein